jgi:DNA modification methylase
MCLIIENKKHEAYKESRDVDDERHVHPLQLDVIERACVLWSNPGEVVLTPFMGVGSEGYAALRAGRRFIGTELKPAYFRQAVRNLMEMESQTGAPSLLSAAGMA